MMLQLSLPVASSDAAATPLSAPLLAIAQQPGAENGEQSANAGFAALLAGQEAQVPGLKLAQGLLPTAPEPIVTEVSLAPPLVPPQGQTAAPALPLGAAALPEGGKSLPGTVPGTVPGIVPVTLPALPGAVSLAAETPAPEAPLPVAPRPEAMAPLLVRMARPGGALPAAAAGKTEEPEGKAPADTDLPEPDAPAADTIAPPAPALLPLAVAPAPPRTEPQQDAAPVVAAAIQPAPAPDKPDKRAASRTAPQSPVPASPVAAEAPRFAATALAALAPAEAPLREVMEGSQPTPSLTAPPPAAGPLAAPDLRAAGPAQAAAPLDLAQLVDNIARARAEAQPTAAGQVHVALHHAEFGAVSLRFEHERGGDLTVAMTSPDPDFARAVAAVTAPERGALAPDSGSARQDGGRQDASPRQSATDLAGEGRPGSRQRESGEQQHPSRPAPLNAPLNAPNHAPHHAPHHAHASGTGIFA
jgi:hypothetical protein